MTGPAPGPAPAEKLKGTLDQALADLAEVAGWAPSVTTEDEADRATRILDRLGAELTEAAILVQQVPRR